jgi:hypothetical protein
MTKIPWIHIRDSSPEEDEWVLVLYGTRDKNYNDEMLEYLERDGDCIQLGEYDVGFSDFLDWEHQKLNSEHWYPIVKVNVRQDYEMNVDLLIPQFDKLTKDITKDTITNKEKIE